MREAFSFVVCYFFFFFFHFSDIVEGVFVRYKKDGKPHTGFASLEKPATLDAEGITNSILNAIKALNHTNVSDEDYLKSNFVVCLINVNFAGASVISGHISRV